MNKKNLKKKEYRGPSAISHKRDDRNAKISELHRD
jgi:hypothetical protein